MDDEAGVGVEWKLMWPRPWQIYPSNNSRAVLRRLFLARPQALGDHLRQRRAAFVSEVDDQAEAYSDVLSHFIPPRRFSRFANILAGVRHSPPLLDFALRHNMYSETNAWAYSVSRTLYGNIISNRSTVGQLSPRFCCSESGNGLMRSKGMFLCIHRHLARSHATRGRVA